MDELELAEALQVPAAEVAAALEQLARDYDGHPVPDDGGTLEHSTAENSHHDPTPSASVPRRLMPPSVRQATATARTRRGMLRVRRQARAPETAGSRSASRAA
ncbi:hypothetical protein A5N15_08810 [Rothia kristinae]|uniref:Uncharacterized protein n=1 Tax=Rothia kristinae TaxID=37923 RepID=A0A657IVD5_9MICC|nr:hypothetical protein A5N15_08810 [Rothia kristinae]